jgi:hypothetical protein
MYRQEIEEREIQEIHLEIILKNQSALNRRVYRFPSNSRCTDSPVEWRHSLAPGGVFTELCVVIEGVGVCDVTHGNAEVTWPLLPIAPSTLQYFTYKKQQKMEMYEPDCAVSINE